MQANSLIAATATATATALVFALAACRVDETLPPAPAAAATAAEGRQAERLRAHIATTPGVAAVNVLVTLPPSDPFARTATATPARAAVVVATTAGADTGVIGDVSISAARTVLGPDVDVQVQIAPPPAVPRLTQLGPFDVAAGSRRALIATLAFALIVAGGLAAALVWALYRRGTRPHQSRTRTTRGS